MRYNSQYLLLIWKDPKTRRNFTVGKLTKEEKYLFEYCEEADEAESNGWRRLESFPERKKYESETLFPVFLSRLPDPKRRDIKTILKKYGLNDYNDFELLRRSRAKLPIDTYEFVDPIISEDGDVEIDFYIMGMRYHAPCNGDDCEANIGVEIGETLMLQEEPTNPQDSFAIKLLTRQKICLGYVPRYYNQTILNRLNQGNIYECRVLETNANKGACSECVKVRLTITKSYV